MDQWRLPMNHHRTVQHSSFWVLQGIQRQTNAFLKTPLALLTLFYNCCSGQSSVSVPFDRVSLNQPCCNSIMDVFHTVSQSSLVITAICIHFLNSGNRITLRYIWYIMVRLLLPCMLDKVSFARGQSQEVTILSSLAIGSLVNQSQNDQKSLITQNGTCEFLTLPYSPPLEISGKVCVFVRICKILFI